MNEEVRKRLMECGYDYGFECPALGSDEPYPDYIRQNVEECIDRIRGHQNGDSITFAFMTDIHYLPLPHHDVLLERNINAYRNICKKVRCDKLILGGDYIIDSPKKDKLSGYRKLSDYLMEFGYFPVNGNHDSGLLWDIFMGYDKPVNMLSKEEIYDAFYHHLPQAGAVFDEAHQGLYYYVDDDDRKVRYIMLDICDLPEQYENTLSRTLAFSQKQLDWLANVALVTQYDIILVSHSVLRPSRAGNVDTVKQKSAYLGVILPLLDAYKNGERFEKRFFEGEFALRIEVDYSNIERGNILGVFVGHYHDDYLEYTESGVPVIFTANFFMAECHVPRRTGDKKELLFDIVTIDRKSRTIHMTRVGAGEDRVAVY